MPPDSVYTCAPLYPSLLALEKEQSNNHLTVITDAFHEIYDESSPWLSYEGGRLRGLVESMLAEQIMYYERRRNRLRAALSFSPSACWARGGREAARHYWLRQTQYCAAGAPCCRQPALHGGFIAVCSIHWRASAAVQRSWAAAWRPSPLP